MKKKLLVLGASGFIGKTICEAFAEDYEVYGTYHTTRAMPEGTVMMRFDVTNPNQLTDILKTVTPDVVISSLRGDFAHQLDAHRTLANYLREQGIRLFYLSTANVFDAVPDKPHGESDPVNANSDYGRYKIDCESMLQSVMGALVTVIRIPMVFGQDSPRVLAVREASKAKQPLTVYRDFYISIHSDILLAKQIRFLIEENIEESIIHLSSQDVLSHTSAMSMLIKKIHCDDIEFNYTKIQEQPYYLALRSEKNILPIDLIFNADQVIEALKS